MFSVRTFMYASLSVLLSASLVACDDPSESTTTAVVDGEVIGGGDQGSGNDGGDVTDDGTVDEETDGTTDLNQVVTIDFVEADPVALAPSSQVGENSTTVSFVVRDLLGNPVADKDVSFSLTNTTGGITIAGETQQATTSDNGIVFAVVNAGTQSTSFRVIADLLDGESTLSDEIGISSGVPVASSFSIGIDKLNFPKAARVLGQENNIQVYITDQLGNRSIDGSVINFKSPETGLIGDTCVIANGECSVVWKSTSAGRFVDGVEYLTLIEERVSVLAHTNGAEDFFDENGNGIYDLGEDFTDLPELYLDENENNQYDLLEFFIDDNGNGVYDAVGNGLWDGPCFSGDCGGGRSFATIGDEVWFLLPRETVFDTSSSTFIDGETIDLRADNASAERTVTVANFNRENAPPAGTVFTVTGTNVELVGNTSFTIGERQRAPYQFKVRMRKDPNAEEDGVVTVTSGYDCGCGDSTSSGLFLEAKIQNK